MIHELKCWPEPFQAIWEGKKTYELRKNDRDFQVGDFLQLEEYNPASGQYSGRCLRVRVTYLTSNGAWGLPEDMCILAIHNMTLGKE